MSDPNETMQTRRLDEVKVDAVEGESNYATLIIIRDKKVFSSVTLEEPVTVIGRNPECLIALPTDTEASRQHAQVRLTPTVAKTRQYLLSDLGSTNGTTLNGKRLKANQEVLLNDGDKFTVGHHLFKFAMLDQSKEKFLSGNLTQISLFDLVQIIENNRLTCILAIRSQTLSGQLFFNHGQIVDCEMETLRGLEGFRKLATIEEGFFEVERYESPFPQNIQAPSNMNLVLDTLREIDEERAGVDTEDEEDQVTLPGETKKTGFNESMLQTTKHQAIDPNES